MDFKSRLKILIIFLLIFGSIAFILGTYTLALIVESVVFFIRYSNWMRSYENLIVIFIIVAYLTFSFFVSKWFTIWFINSKKKSSKVTFSVILFLILLAALFYWFFPKNTFDETQFSESNDGRFVAGPYPDESVLLKIKREHFTGIISLLNPGILPFEPILLKKEEESAEDLEIPFTSIPMLPWVSENKEAIKKITYLAQHGSANDRFYVNCYYGRDRVNLFLSVVNRTSTFPKSKIKQTLVHTVDVLPKKVMFERGYALKVDEHTIFSSKPTADEFLFLLQNGRYFSHGIKTVYSIDINPQDADERNLGSYGVKFISNPIQFTPYDPQKILKTAQEIKTLPGPVLVYAFYMPPHLYTANIEGLMLAYLTNLPAIPISVFNADVYSNKGIMQIAPNIVIGPKLKPTEYKNILKDNGLQTAIYIGDCANAVTEKKSFISANLNWSCYSTNDLNLLLATIKQGGPYYIYGSGLSEIKNDLMSEFSNSFPSIYFKIMRSKS